MRTPILATAFAATLFGAAGADAADKPTIVLVHGAFADSSSWNRVIPILQQDGYTRCGRQTRSAASARRGRRIVADS